MARSIGDEQLERYGMDVLTVAVLSIMITAPIGALAIGLAGPKLLQKYTEIEETNTQGTQGNACTHTHILSFLGLHAQTRNFIVLIVTNGISFLFFQQIKPETSRLQNYTHKHLRLWRANYKHTHTRCDSITLLHFCLFAFDLALLFALFIFNCYKQSNIIKM